MDLELTRAESRHCATLSAIAYRSKSVWGYSKEFMASCREEITVSKKKIRNKRFTHYFASDGQDPVGFYSLERLTDTTVELEALFVKPEQIGKGVGSILLKHAIQTAKKMGFAKMLI